jgi:DNA polymerase (family 10)
MLTAETDLSELPGIGKDLAGKIADIVKTGRFELLETLKKKLPGELGEMAALPGLGPKRIKLLYDKLRVRTLDDLRRAIESGRLHKLRGFGAVTEVNLAKALKKPAKARRFKLATAEAEAEALIVYLRDYGRVVVAGSYRRRRDTVGDLDVLVTAKHDAAVGDRLVAYENVSEVLDRGFAVRHSSRRARSAGAKLWCGAFIFHWFQGAQYRTPRHCEQARVEAERIRAVFG